MSNLLYSLAFSLLGALAAGCSCKVLELTGSRSGTIANLVSVHSKIERVRGVKNGKSLVVACTSKEHCTPAPRQSLRNWWPILLLLCWGLALNQLQIYLLSSHVREGERQHVKIHQFPCATCCMKLCICFVPKPNQNSSWLELFVPLSDKKSQCRIPP